MTKGLVLMGIALLVATSVPAEAGAPLDKVQSAVTAVIEIVTRPDLAGDHNPVLRRALVRQVADDFFDFHEMARRALGYHWAASSQVQRAEFLRLFTDLLEGCYVRTIENYHGEKIVYLLETIDGDYATVRSKIVTARRAEITVDYRLYQSVAGWSAYDVALENVSLVAHYRQQFDRVIRKASFKTLLERMRGGEVAVLRIPAGAGRPD